MIELKLRKTHFAHSENVVSNQFKIMEDFLRSLKRTIFSRKRLMAIHMMI